VSTVASGKRMFETYVDTSDITLMHSVVDFFGLNAILKQILTNAAGAISGMVNMGRIPYEPKPEVAITIYGTTTPAGMSIVSLLQRPDTEWWRFIRMEPEDGHGEDDPGGKVCRGDRSDDPRTGR